MRRRVPLRTQAKKGRRPRRKTRLGSIERRLALLDDYQNGLDGERIHLWRKVYDLETRVEGAVAALRALDLTEQNVQHLIRAVTVLWSADPPVFPQAALDSLGNHLCQLPQLDEDGCPASDPHQWARYVLDRRARLRFTAEVRKMQPELDVDLASDTNSMGLPLVDGDGKKVTK